MGWEPGKSTQKSMSCFQDDGCWNITLQRYSPLTTLTISTSFSLLNAEPLWLAWGSILLFLGGRSNSIISCKQVHVLKNAFILWRYNIISMKGMMNITTKTSYFCLTWTLIFSKPTSFDSSMRNSSKKDRFTPPLETFFHWPRGWNIWSMVIWRKVDKSSNTFKKIIGVNYILVHVKNEETWHNSIH